MQRTRTTSSHEPLDSGTATSFNSPCATLSFLPRHHQRSRTVWATCTLNPLTYAKSSMTPATKDSVLTYKEVFLRHASARSRPPCLLKTTPILPYTLRRMPVPGVGLAPIRDGSVVQGTRARAKTAFVGLSYTAPP